MSKSSIKVFTDLNHKLMKLDARKHELGLLTKDYYFTRKPKKLSFIDDMKLIMSMGPSSIKEEMYKYFGYSLDTVSASGFIESRVKIKDAAFKELMNEMNKAYPCKKTYKGYRLLAVDGSDITIPIDKNDHETVKSNGDKKQSAMYHLNALYDIINHRYLDAIIQGVRNENEKRAMIDLTKNYKGDKAIFIADRGYSSYNLFENIRNTGNYFLIRIKDYMSKQASRAMKSIKFDAEFDEEVEVTFTNKQTNEIKSQPVKYISIMSNQNFDFLDKDNNFYDAKYRFVRIRIDGKDEEYETLITNLSKDELSSDDIKELYKLRWDIEVSYKHLKYSVNLNALHSKRRDFIKQEIWARLVMFNISMIIIDDIQENKVKKNERNKYEYKICISKAIHLICGSITKRKGGVPPNLIELIAKEILPIRPGRSSIRNVKTHSFVSFNYRFC